MTSAAGQRDLVTSMVRGAGDGGEIKGGSGVVMMIAMVVVLAAVDEGDGEQPPLSRNHVTENKMTDMV